MEPPLLPERLDCAVVVGMIATLTDLPEPEDPYDCTDDEFRALLRDAKLWREHLADGS